MCCTLPSADLREGSCAGAEVECSGHEGSRARRWVPAHLRPPSPRLFGEGLRGAVPCHARPLGILLAEARVPDSDTDREILPDREAWSGAVPLKPADCCHVPT
jgi:hypothetical protein